MNYFVSNGEFNIQNHVSNKQITILSKELLQDCQRTILCGHRMCSECVKSLFANSRLPSVPCPVCNRKLAKRHFQQDPAIQSLVHHVTSLLQYCRMFDEESSTNFNDTIPLPPSDDDDDLLRFGSSVLVELKNSTTAKQRESPERSGIKSEEGRNDSSILPPSSNEEDDLMF